jgi:Zn finger protein HypA/HybF involved in hydrogenase expression
MAKEEEISTASEDTIFKCENCSGPVMHKHIQEGGCAQCGGRRVKFATKLTKEDIEFLQGEGYVFDPERWSDVPFPRN